MSRLHVARRTDLPLCADSIPREKQGGVSYPALTHGVIHRQPLRGFLVESGEWKMAASPLVPYLRDGMPVE